MSKADEESLSEILYGTSVLLPMKTSSKGGKVECLCRIAQGREKDWPAIAERLLKVSSEADIDIHVCRRYLLKDSSMVYGAHVSVEASSARKLKISLGVLGQSFSSNKPASAVTSAPASPSMSYSDYKKQTTAHARAPIPESPRIPAPPGFTYQTKKVKEETGSSGRPVIIEEIPLPHVHHEMNVPNSKGRGAKYT